MSRVTSFSTCIHLYNTRHCPPAERHRPTRFPCVSSQLTAISTLESHHRCDFFHHRLIWSVFKLPVNEISSMHPLCQASCNWSIIFEGLPFCRLYRELFPFVAEWYFVSIPRMFIHFLVMETCVVPVWGCRVLFSTGRLSFPLDKYLGENYLFIGAGLCG